MTPRIQINPRPNHLRLYHSLLTISLRIGPPGTFNRGTPTADLIEFLHIFLAHPPPLRITQTETIARVDGVEVTATEPLSLRSEGGGMVSIACERWEWEERLRKEWEDGEMVGKWEVFRDEWKGEVRGRTEWRVRGEVKDGAGEGEEDGLKYSTHGWDVVEDEVRDQGEGKKERERWRVVRVGIKGWVEIEWDEGRWEDEN